MKKVAVLSGKRGGFGAMIGLMEMIQNDPLMELQLIVTDMHLSNIFGYTAKEVERFFPISYKVVFGQKDDSAVERGRALGLFVSRMVDVLSEARPDILITLGDRGEVLSATIAAMELNIPVAHILGGDVAGNRDGNRIHAITKLSHLHFPSSADSADRILKLGEESHRVHTVGATYIDFVMQGRFTNNRDVRRMYAIGEEEPYAICIQHPMTLKECASYDEALSVYGALRDYGIRTLVIYPCSDQGYQGTLRALDEFRTVPYFSVHKNIDALDFWGLMDGASFFIGNSSSGLIETPYFGLPSVTVGKRQEGRVRDVNVISCNPVKEDILEAIDKATSYEFRNKIVNNYIFGDGTAGKKIYEIIRNIDVDDDLLMKKITY